MLSRINDAHIAGEGPSDSATTMRFRARDNVQEEPLFSAQQVLSCGKTNQVQYRPPPARPKPY